MRVSFIIFSCVRSATFMLTITSVNTPRNTCYLNSSIQCLSHTPILRDYFTSKSYLRDINTTNPLGHEGRLAQAFAVLVHDLWKKHDNANGDPTKTRTMSSSTPLDAPSMTPKSFKEAIGKFNEDFAGEIIAAKLLLAQHINVESYANCSSFVQMKMIRERATRCSRVACISA